MTEAYANFLHAAAVWSGEQPTELVKVNTGAEQTWGLVVESYDLLRKDAVRYIVAKVGSGLFIPDENHPALKEVEQDNKIILL